MMFASFCLPREGGDPLINSFILFVFYFIAGSPLSRGRQKKTFSAYKVS
jgi:hypothetical protein